MSLRTKASQLSEQSIRPSKRACLERGCDLAPVRRKAANMADLPTCHRVTKGRSVSEADSCSLTYDQRFLRRRVLTTQRGLKFLVDLRQTTSLDHGDALELDNGCVVAITAAPENLLEVRGDLARLAWHIGNRHSPCQIEPERLLVQHDHVLRDMIVRLGAEVTEAVEPFSPEGGAYGIGRTHSHSHGSSQSHDHQH